VAGGEEQARKLPGKKILSPRLSCNLAARTNRTALLPAVFHEQFAIGTNKCLQTIDLTIPFVPQHCKYLNFRATWGSDLEQSSGTLTFLEL
jgi:hypothetical protein